MQEWRVERMLTPFLYAKGVIDHETVPERQAVMKKWLRD
jgi:hypothetical protein